MSLRPENLNFVLLIARSYCVLVVFRVRLTACLMLLAALTVAPSDANAGQCKSLYRNVDFCPEALDGIASIGTNEKDQLTATYSGEKFVFWSAFFDHENVQERAYALSWAIFQLEHVISAMPDAETVSEESQIIQSRQAVTASKQNRTFNRRIVGYSTSVQIGDDVLVVFSKRAAKDFDVVDREFHEKALNAFRIGDEG